MGGVFNTVNLHTYHYAGNNPVKYVDPDGRIDMHLGGGIGLAAVKLRIQFKNNRLTLGIKVGVGYGFEAKVILTDQDEDIGTKITALTEGSGAIKIGEQGAVGLDAEISYNSQGEGENRLTAALTVPGSDLSVELAADKGKIKSSISESIEYGVSVMVFAGIGYETTTEIDKNKETK
jgi:hypothetical protein